MSRELLQILVHEAAGVVDELGEGVAAVPGGDNVFSSAEEVAQAEPAVASPMRRSRRHSTSAGGRRMVCTAVPTQGRREGGRSRRDRVRRIRADRPAASGPLSCPAFLVHRIRPGQFLPIK